MAAQVVKAPLASEKIPFELQGIGIDEKTGEKIDLGLNFTDENGQPVKLKGYFNVGVPVIIALVYYGCPNLCSLVLNSTIDSLREINLRPGRDYKVVAISFDPRETSKLASAKKASYMDYLMKSMKEKAPSAAETQNWHFLTGSAKSTQAITQQMGFHYRWDTEILQFAHASAIYVLTPEGQISRMFYGIMYPPRDLKLALLEAGKGKIGSVMDQLLLFCFHYDASAKRYVVMAQKIMMIGGAVTLAILIVFMALFWKKEIITLKEKS